MKCTNKKDMSLDSSLEERYRRRRIQRARRRRRARIVTLLIFLLIIGAAVTAVLTVKRNYEQLLAETPVTEFEAANYLVPMYDKTSLFSGDICVGPDDVSYSKFSATDNLYASALFNVKDNTVVMAQDMHEKLYPASTTKIVTLYLALKYGNMDDKITLTKESIAVPYGSSCAWLAAGEQVTLKDLVYSMMVKSGNDSARAIAFHISGSEEEFAKLMTEEARLLGATNSNFVNAHGFHDENHYTTAYDLYLIMNALLEYDLAKEIMSSKSYKTTIVTADGSTRVGQWWQTNNYLTGASKLPEGLTLIGGKTGTTSEAKCCLILATVNEAEVPYISVILGAPSKVALYNNMSSLISTVAN